MFYSTADEQVNQQLLIGNFDAAYKVAATSEKIGRDKLIHHVDISETKFRTGFCEILESDIPLFEKYLRLGRSLFDYGAIDLAKHCLMSAKDLSPDCDLAEPLADSLGRYWQRKREGLSSQFCNTVYSASLEQEQAEFLLSEIGNITGGFIVDIGAGDGLHWSNSRKFIDQGFGGILVEGLAERFASLESNCKHVEGDVTLLNSFVDIDSINTDLRSARCPREFDILTIDIDSFDYQLCKTILEEYAPSIVIVEINERVPPPFQYLISESLRGIAADMSLVSSASISTYYRMLNQYGYVPVMMEYNNLIAVKRNRMSARVSDLARSPLDLYNLGYYWRPDRDTIFPYNANLVGKYQGAASIATRDVFDALRSYSAYSNYLSHLGL